MFVITFSRTNANASRIDRYVGTCLVAVMSDIVVCFAVSRTKNTERHRRVSREYNLVSWAGCGVPWVRDLIA